MDNLLINYGEIIKKARKERKITQTVLGAKIGVGKTAVCNYETSANLPPRNMFLKIAEALSYTPEEMIAKFMPSGSSALGDPHIIQPRFSAPITRINNSTCDEGVSLWHTNDSFAFPADVLSGDEQYVCFKAADNSMEDDGILKNDHLFVRLTKDIPQKSIVLFKSKLSGSYYVRRYFRDGHIVSMMPSRTQTRFEPIRYDDRDNDYEIVGVVEKVLTSVR